MVVKQVKKRLFSKKDPPTVVRDSIRSEFTASALWHQHQVSRPLVRFSVEKMKNIYFVPVRFCGSSTPLRKSENGNSTFIDV